MQNSLLDKHVSEIDEEIALANSLAPAPLPSPQSQYGTQIGGQINKSPRERHDEYTRVIQNIKEKYLNSEFIDLFAKAYRQLDIYLAAYYKLIGTQNAAQFKKEPAIFLDFGEKAKFCRYPQAHKYIITVPQEDANAKIWTSMAHELGHLVYWNSGFDSNETAGSKDYILLSSKIVGMFGIKLTDLEGAIDSKEKLLATMLVGWSEEIFADTFGAMVGGKTFAEQTRTTFLNDLANSELGNKRFEMDTEHPYAFLRPYISATALAKYEKDKGEGNTLWGLLKAKITTDPELKINFQNSLNGLSNPKGTVTDDISDKNLKVKIIADANYSTDFYLDEIKQALAKLIQVFVDEIPKSKPLERSRRIWDHIEKFDDPSPNLVYRVIQGIGYWVKASWS